MAESNYTIDIQGAGGKSAKIDTSEIQKSIDAVVADFKKLDLSNFQISLKDLTLNIQKSAIAANNFVTNMSKMEAQISASIKAGLSPGIAKIHEVNQEANSKENHENSASGMNTKNTEKFTASLGTLSDAIDKLTTGIKENFKPRETPESRPETEEKKSNLINDTKKLLAAVGIGAIAKQIAENEIVNPARATGMLINSNVVSNPTQAGSMLLNSYQNRVANDTGTIFGVAGGIVGGVAGSLIPGLGTIYGAALGYGGGKLLGDTLGQKNMATELPTLQRALTTDYYSSLSRQLPQYQQFAESQYGDGGFLASKAQEPYFESKAEFGKSFSRFAGGSLDAKTTSGILESLAAQGASSPQEVSTSANLLGQIARFTGKSSVDIEKVYKSVEKSGMTPNEGLQKALSLLQSGQSVNETTDIIRRDSQRTEAYSAGQLNYLSATPFQQFSAQLAGNVTGVNQEKFFHGTDAEKARELAKARKIFQGSDRELRSGHLGHYSILTQFLEEHQGIWPGMADNNRKVTHAKESAGFLKVGEGAKTALDSANKAITEGAKGRSPTQIIQEAITEMGNSTLSMKGLSGATDTLIGSFKAAAMSLEQYVWDNSAININRTLYPELNPSLAHKKTLTQKPGGK